VVAKVVAFVGSFLIALLGLGAVLAYGNRRPVGAPLTWGEAIFAATLAFALMFWAYGVVPHQWLQWANNELEWNAAKPLLKPDQFTFFSDTIRLPPFSVSYETLSHTIVVVIYGIFLGAHVAAWSIWQNRGKRAEQKAQRELAPSSYGRPLVKQG
jgi:hypothetical protein